jgi:poly(3-hydroxybutyrate) depolymerase
MYYWLMVVFLACLKIRIWHVFTCFLIMKKGGEDDGSCDHGEAFYKNDEEYVSRTLDFLSVELGANISKVFMFGHSGGGTMAWRLGCSSTLGGQVAGIGVSGGFFAPALRKAAVCGGLHVAMFHGTEDTFVSVDLADDTFEWFTRTYNCNSTASYSMQKNLQLRLTGMQEYDTNAGICDFRNRLGYFRITGGGHTIPGSIKFPLCVVNYFLSA